MKKYYEGRTFKLQEGSPFPGSWSHFYTMPIGAKILLIFFHYSLTKVKTDLEMCSSKKVFWKYIANLLKNNFAEVLLWGWDWVKMSATMIGRRLKIEKKHWLKRPKVVPKKRNLAKILTSKYHIWNSFFENIISCIQCFYIWPDVPVEIIIAFF